MQLKVKTTAHDEELAILRKEVTVADKRVDTPSKTLRPENLKDSDSSSMLCEVSRRIDATTLEQIHGAVDFASELVQSIKRKKVNNQSLVHFNLCTNELPDKDHTVTLAHSLYAASDDIVCLPTVKKSVFMQFEPGRKTPIISDKRVDVYVEFQKCIIDALKMKNSKAILGAIPLFLPPKFTNPLIDFYFDQEVTHFVIDANTSNILNKETNVRAILNRITENAKERKETLEDTFIHAMNLGINQFEAEEIPADDLLSLFAYIDSFGITFKSRGRKPNKRIDKLPDRPPRKKRFSREHYVYKILNGAKSSKSKTDVTLASLKAQNERNQYKEATFLQGGIGEESMMKYLGQKRGVSKITYKKLQTIYSSIKL